MLPPKPPRQPRLRTALHRRWLIGLVGSLSLLTMVGITVAYTILGADVTSLADEALDRSASSIRGEVISVEPTLFQTGADSWQSVRFRFPDLTGRMREGRSLVRRTQLEQGMDCWVEYLRNDSETNRLRGTTRQIQAPLLDAVVRWVLLPGILLFLFWLQGVVRLRNLLRTGPATYAKITKLRRIGWINPPQLWVDYSFSDHRGKEHRNWHWVGQRTGLGKQCREPDPNPPAVIYDESNPSRSRLVDADSFLN